MDQTASLGKVLLQFWPTALPAAPEWKAGRANRRILKEKRIMNTDQEISRTVRYRNVNSSGVKIFYREAGDRD
jgi:hypothetical protein